MSVLYKHLVIGGANKCGTTSLFRYLADHPRICGSSIKETNFFSDAGIAESAYEDYLGIFPKDRHGADWLLEGTPSYLDGGAKTAGEIHRLLPEAILVFVLREPIDRLLSFYKSKLGLTSAISHGMSLDEFASRALDIATEKTQPRDAAERNIGWQVTKAGYARFIEEYLGFFPVDQVAIVFFDDFRADPGSAVSRICQIAGLDDAYLDAYEFSVANRSRFHRSKTLRTLGSRINRQLEPVLNRMPATRQVLRKTYNRMNTTDRQALSLSADIVEELGRYYAPVNDDLRLLLQTKFGISQLPRWLSASQ